MSTLTIKTPSSLFLILIIICFSTITYAQEKLSLDEIMATAKNYYEQRNGQEAMQWYLKAAKKGYEPAMNKIGHMYLHGDTVKRDCQQAM